MRDYLSLVGDASDNVKGAAGIGPKKAAELLQKYGSLDAVYAELAAHPTHFKPAMATALQEFKARMDETRTLVTLRTDVDIPFETIAAERTPKDVPFEPMEDAMETVMKNRRCRYR
jgi:DNA polymerase-1